MANTNKSIIGGIGEDIACGYLKKNGYRILGRNYRKKYGEIDIVAIAADKTVVFVEVKTMTASTGGDGLTPEDQMSSAKLKKTRRIAQIFAAAHPDLVSEDSGWRLDLIAITLRRKGTGEIDTKDSQITHYESI
jgi:putative endonuclease